jgi:hypothetical protein
MHWMLATSSPHVSPRRRLHPKFQAPRPVPRQPRKRPQLLLLLQPQPAFLKGTSAAIGTLVAMDSSARLIFGGNAIHWPFGTPNPPASPRSQLQPSTLPRHRVQKQRRRLHPVQPQRVSPKAMSAVNGTLAAMATSARLLSGSVVIPWLLATSNRLASLRLLPRPSTPPRPLVQKQRRRLLPVQPQRVFLKVGNATNGTLVAMATSVRLLYGSVVTPWLLATLNLPASQ